MKKRSTCSRTLRYLLISLAGGLFALSGCDPQVRTTVLSGLNAASTGLSTTLIDAFFQKLQSEDGTGGGTGT